MNKILYKLEAFEGPLDLLLHLINKNKLDIKDIKIGILLEQYINHINQMEKLGIQIKSEFLDMVSRLIYIKTLSLLPKSEEEKNLKEELSTELIEHWRLKFMCEAISEKINWNCFIRLPENIMPEKNFRVKINTEKFIKCYINVCKGSNLALKELSDTKIQKITTEKIVSVQCMAISILRKLKKAVAFSYRSLFTKSTSKSSVIATFLAVLELIKIKRIKIKEGLIKMSSKEP